MLSNPLQCILKGMFIFKTADCQTTSRTCTKAVDERLSAFCNSTQITQGTVRDVLCWCAMKPMYILGHGIRVQPDAELRIFFLFYFHISFQSLPWLNLWQIPKLTDDLPLSLCFVPARVQCYWSNYYSCSCCKIHHSQNNRSTCRIKQTRSEWVFFLTNVCPWTSGIYEVNAYWKSHNLWQVCHQAVSRLSGDGQTWKHW